MNTLLYYLKKVEAKIFGNKEIINNFFRKKGAKIGKKCNICSNICTPETYLIELKDNVTIGANVEFITHDNSISKVFPNCTDLFGKIIIGNNCFVGARSVVMYGVELNDDIIVASGSVVTKSFKEKRIIIGGNPAKKIATWEDFEQKNQSKAFDLTRINKKDLRNIVETSDDKLVKRKWNN